MLRKCNILRKPPSLACALIGFGMAACMLAPLYGVPIMKSYPSKYIPCAIIGLALSAVLVHAVIGEMFLGAPTALYIFYAVIMGVHSRLELATLVSRARHIEKQN